MSQLKEGLILTTPNGKQYRLGPVFGKDGDVCGARLIPIPTHPLKPRGDAERHRLVAARLGLREGQHA